MGAPRKSNEKLVEIRRKNLEYLEGQEWALSNIVPGDKSWVYLRKIGNKISNSRWGAENTKTDHKLMICLYIKTIDAVLVNEVLFFFLSKRGRL